MRATWTLAPLVATAVLLVGCGGASPAANANKVQPPALQSTTASNDGLAPPVGASPVPASPSAVPKRLFLMEGGLISRPLANGSVLPMGRFSEAEVYVSPFPPSPKTQMDIYFYDGSTDRAISDASMNVEYEMLYMDHGLYKRETVNRGNGHYTTALEFEMYGEWVVRVNVKDGEEWSHLQLEFTVGQA